MKLLAFLIPISACWAGDFINLTFDEPDLSGPLTPLYPGGPMVGETRQLLRGWTALEAGHEVTSMSYTPYGFGCCGSPFSLFESSPEQATTAFGANQLLLQSPFSPGSGELRLKQTGTIPADAVGLWIFAGGQVQMFVNGERINDPRIGSLADPIVDVSKYAGQTVSLEFLVPLGSSARLDIFGFTQVPEPSTWALLVVGVTALAWQCRRRKAG